MAQLIPVGPGIPAGVAAVLKSHQDAITALRQPGQPTTFGHIALKASLTADLAAQWPSCAIICDEINSLCVSTLVAGAYAWLRADGSAI